MSNLILPRREIWTQQPPNAVGIDWASPITAKLVSAVLPSAKLFAGTHPHSSGFVATNTQVTKYGVALGRGGFNWGLPQRPVFGVPATSDMTLLAFMYGDSSTTTESNPVTTGQNAASISSSISVGDGTTKALRYRIYLGGTRYAGGSSVIPAEPTVVVGRQRYGVEQALFVGGEKDPVTSSFTGGHSGVTHFGCYSGNQLTKVLISALWARALSDAEIRSLSENPWQIFAPRETRIFVPLGAGGGGATATGGFAPLTISPAGATASGGAAASAPLAQVSLSTFAGTASGSAVGGGALAPVSISPVEGTATGTSAGGAIASGDFAPITVSPLAGTASGTAVSQGGMPPITLSPFAGVGVAINPSSAVAVGAFAGLTISPFYGIGLGPADFSWEAALPLSPTGVWQSNAASPATVWTPAPKFHV